LSGKPIKQVELLIGNEQRTRRRRRCKEKEGERAKEQNPTNLVFDIALNGGMGLRG